LRPEIIEHFFRAKLVVIVLVEYKQIPKATLIDGFKEVRDIAGNAVDNTGVINLHTYRVPV
jgi:hypothetical protein